MMIFIMALCIDNPLLLFTCIGIGVSSGSLAAVLTAPAPVVLEAADMANLALMPVVVLCSMAFSHAISKGRISVEKNRALQALAGSIAHEMRNPLGQLRHVLDRVEEALPATTPSDRQYADSTAALYGHLAHGQLSIERGLRIIAMTLDEVSAKSIRPDSLSYLNAAATTRKAVEEYGFDNEKERGKVNLVVREDFIFKADETVYLFTLFNLIKNALYHIAAHPSATLTLTVDRQCVIVRDTGNGIAPEILAHLFEPFRTAKNPGGTGLGLAYCQRAMRAFGGTIGCESEVGKFTAFTLRFPVVSKEEIADYEQKIFERAAPVFKGKRILIVDDDAGQRSRTRRVLTKAGADVSEAQSGAMALTTLRRSSHYDLVLMDISMPVLDGYATTERIRADHQCPNRSVLIVAYTAEPGNAVRVHARRAGMDEIISKSSGVQELITSLQARFENGDRHPLNPRSDGFAGKSILVADDDTYSRLVAKAYLERCGANVVEAEHGQAVLARLREDDMIDAILMDMNMPGMTGIDTTASIRARTDVYATVPIIALTSQSDIESVRACLAAGMNEVMIKPVQAGSLYACLARQFAPQRAVTAATKPESSPASATAAGNLAAVAHDALLDEERLEELVSLDLLDESFVNGIEQIRLQVARLATHAAAHDLKSTHAALHALLGVSGNIGAKALHGFARQIYPRVIEREWPAEPDWLGQISTLGERSARALQTYYASAKARRDHRNALSD
ncbi:ATP-binding response regulator [Paraburkholderia ribeironis]|nr:hybrid sensor histidine kinase/response regulator [Paraburkholderia ribeironis]